MRAPGAAPRLHAQRRTTPSTSRQTVEATLLDWRKRYLVRKVWFDPFQMVSVAQRLAKAHVPIEEYPQTIPNLTAATQNLFDLIQARTLVLYPDAGNAARGRAARSSPRAAAAGARQAQAEPQDRRHRRPEHGCLAAVRGQSEPSYDLWACFPDHERTM